MSGKISKEAIQIIEELQDELNKMLKMGSTIDVVWKMEQLHSEKAFQKSADFIRRKLDYEDSEEHLESIINDVKKQIKEKYPNATNIEDGTNGIIVGVWFYKDENAKTRTFSPLKITL
jgi:hypothetical protein